MVDAAHTKQATEKQQKTFKPQATQMQYNTKQESRQT